MISGLRLAEGMNELKLHRGSSQPEATHPVFRAAGPSTLPCPSHYNRRPGFPVSSYPTPGSHNPAPLGAQQQRWRTPAIYSRSNICFSSPTGKTPSSCHADRCPMHLIISSRFLSLKRGIPASSPIYSYKAQTSALRTLESPNTESLGQATSCAIMAIGEIGPFDRHGGWTDPLRCPRIGQFLDLFGEEFSSCFYKVAVAGFYRTFSHEGIVGN